MKIRDIEAFQVNGRTGTARGSAAPGSGFIPTTVYRDRRGITDAGRPRVARDRGADLAPALTGKRPAHHERATRHAAHTFAKLGPEGALTGALAALDIALWDLKGKILDQPIYKLLGGAWRTALPFFRRLDRRQWRAECDEVLRVVERDSQTSPRRQDPLRRRPHPTRLSHPGRHRPGAGECRPLVGDRFPLAFDANNGYSVGGAIRVGRGSWKSSATGGSRSRCSITTCKATGEVAPGGST